jgi:hypothetical protein
MAAATPQYIVSGDHSVEQLRRSSGASLAVPPFDLPACNFANSDRSRAYLHALDDTSPRPSDRGFRILHLRKTKMADATVVHIGENSPEQVAYKLLQTIASQETASTNDLINIFAWSPTP